MRHWPLPELQALFGRLPINQTNAPLFQALLELPYDIYRPVMDLLLAEDIVPEDLLPPPGAAFGGAINGAAAADYNVSPDALMARIRDLAGGARVTPGAVAVPTDPGLLLAEDGRPSGVFVPGGTSVAGVDSTVAVPNAIELARAGTLEEAQKRIQRALAAAVQPDIG